MDFFDWFWKLPKEKLNRIIENGLYLNVYEAYTQGFSSGLNFYKGKGMTNPPQRGARRKSPLRMRELLQLIYFFSIEQIYG